MHQQQQNSLKATPARRRQQRHHLHSPAHKTYASENDLPTELQFPIEFVRGSPFTPQKPGVISPAPSARPLNSKAKTRTSNYKARQKQASTSPAPTRQGSQGHKTPPNAVAPKPTTTTAFAGATFHASPAPSSLPIPSFLAKAMDSPGLKDSESVTQEPSPPATDTEAPTPQRQCFSSKPLIRDESPLDFFFRADRAEKERARRASSANSLAVTLGGPFSPPKNDQFPQAVPTVPRGPAVQARRAPLHRSSTVGISTMELDGTPGRPMGPAFSTPYQERIKAARSAEKQSERSPTADAGHQPLNGNDRSEALKKFLAVGTLSSPSRPELLPHQYGTSPPFTPVAMSPSPAVPQIRRVPAGLSGAGGNITSRPQDLQWMEDNLRRLLKLDSGPGFGQAPTVPDSLGS